MLTVEAENRPRELRCTPASLRGHIVNAHLAPEALAKFGVARYDMDLASFKGIRLDWVAKKAYEILEEDEEASFGRFPKRAEYMYRHCRYFSHRDIQGYRAMIVRNLMYMDQLGLASIDWERVRVAMPEVESITLDIERDSYDGLFSTGVVSTYVTSLNLKTASVAPA